MTLAKYGRKGSEQIEQIWNYSHGGTATQRDGPMLCSLIAVPLCRCESNLALSYLPALEPFVTYMDVGNADLIWNTDRPYFARVLRSFGANLCLTAISA
jgi:hypothetical protein